MFKDPLTLLLLLSESEWRRLLLTAMAANFGLMFATSSKRMLSMGEYMPGMLSGSPLNVADALSPLLLLSLWL